MKKTLLGTGLFTALALVAGPALAHPFHGLANGFGHGLEHPLTGADHLLAMLAVGLWSGFVLPRRVWSGAAVFMAAMMAGGALALAGVAVPGVEAMTLASVVLFGALVAVSRRGQPGAVTAVSLAVIAVFAASHGYAHASEASGLVALYMLGFLISTAGLHLLGIAVAQRLIARPAIQHALGGMIALSGLALIAG